jgi:transposase InsO family protein
MIDTFTK